MLSKDAKTRILAVLNEDLSPWKFSGKEPMCQRLFAAAEEKPSAATVRVSGETFTLTLGEYEISGPCSVQAQLTIRQP